jgi:protein TonB
MGRDMFGEVAHRSVRIGQRRWYTVPLSIVTHALLLAGALLVPLLASDTLPAPVSELAFVVVPSPPRLPPPPLAPAAAPPVTINPEAAPLEAPSTIALEPPPPSFSPGRADGVPGGLPTDAVGSAPVALAPPPATTPEVPVRPGGNIAFPTKVKDVPPLYPPVAVAARVSGLVVIEAVITKEGAVRDARILRSVPLLDQAALAAVRQWRYTPTRLNGVPVEVVMTVTVTFTLR